MIWTIFKFMTGIRDDNREEYFYYGDEPLALLIEGNLEDDIYLQYDTPQHERYIHDGTPHRDPAVYNRTELCWLLGFIPYVRRYQQRYYSLHVSEDGRAAGLWDLQNQIDSTRFRRGQRAEIVTIDESIQRRIERGKNWQQRRRGVPWWLLRPDRSRG